jgi:hypothetical protein
MQLHGMHACMHASPCTRRFWTFSVSTQGIDEELMVVLDHLQMPKDTAVLNLQRASKGELARKGAASSRQT